MRACNKVCKLYPVGKHCVDCILYPWEDEPDRIAYQQWLQNLPKKYDALSASHNGLIGPGAQLKQLIKEYNDEVESVHKQ